MLLVKKKIKFLSLFLFGENKTKNGIIDFSQQFKTPEQTSPVGRSLAVQEADYKSKAVYRLSQPVPMKSFEGMSADRRQTLAINYLSEKKNQ